ncbi:MAG: hypothetical protein KJO69_03720 [Gammaproteobacteria bacterium]|nr:hypothetical protein [Gammaproteobacteria bacterium]NNJ90794.1 hypothetical protein [Gammaproteobacteria bacterium]
MKLSIILMLLVAVTGCGREELSEGRMQDVGYSEGYAAGFNAKCGKAMLTQPKSDDKTYQLYFKLGYADGKEACEKEN